MTTYTKEELNNILKLHEQWLKNEVGGVRADLSGADLSYADLSGADLSYGWLNDANLCRSNLKHANLNDVDLDGADLSGADLTNTNLTDILLFDFIKNKYTRTTPTPSKGSNRNAGKIFKIKSTGKLGFILPYQVFKNWNRGFLNGQVVDFEMSHRVEILE